MRKDFSTRHLNCLGRGFPALVRKTNFFFGGEGMDVSHSREREQLLFFFFFLSLLLAGCVFSRTNAGACGVWEPTHYADTSTSCPQKTFLCCLFRCPLSLNQQYFRFNKYFSENCLERPICKKVGSPLRW